MVYIYDDLQNVTEDELQHDLECLPLWRKELALKYKFHLGKVQCTKAYLLLCKGLREQYGITNLPLFAYGKHKKPFLQDYPDIHFNISHCKTAVMCIIDNVPVGCDIEHVRKEQDDSLLKYCFNDEEIKKIKQSIQPGLIFTEMWTMKEAAVKWSGEGINDNMPILFESLKSYNLKITTLCNLEKNYVYSICKQKNQDEN